MFTGAKYARSGEVNIAYQVVGDGPIDLVLVLGWVSHLAYVWELPAMATFLNRLASFSRLILFDKRGCGMSDRVHPLPTLEQRMDDVRAVMDAAGSKRAALLGISDFPETDSSVSACRAYNNWFSAAYHKLAPDRLLAWRRNQLIA